MLKARRMKAHQRRGVIDIGSNSVRLVVYTLNGRSLVPHYNEKVMAGLGRGLSEYGHLNPVGVEAAIATIKRFRVIAKGLGDVPIDAFATAAVRTASDGDAFVERIRKETGFNVDVLDGQGEATGAALGVLAGLRDVDGVIGDLGGSSLELIHADGGLGVGETHLVGPLAIARNDGSFDEADVRAAVRKSLDTSEVLPGSGGNFYAVGGSWRAFASVHMAMTDYPLRLLQGYTMTNKEVRRLAKRLCNPSDSVQEIAKSVSEKRLPLLPFAAVVLDEVFRVGKFERLVVSAFGLREGRVLGPAPKRRARGRTLLDGLEFVGRLQDPVQFAFADALYDFTAPVVEKLLPVFDDERDDLLMLNAACRLSDIGASLHPDYRSQLAFSLALHGPHAGVDHTERMFLALAAASRYSRSFKAPSGLLRLLSVDQAERARQIGALMRLGAVFSGRTPDTLADASLGLEPGFLVLRSASGKVDMASEFVRRRLQQAASSLGVEPLVG